MFNKALIVAAAASAVAAQRPNDTSICDYYTKALLKENNATNQNTLCELSRYDQSRESLLTSLPSDPGCQHRRHW